MCLDVPTSVRHTHRMRAQQKAEWRAALGPLMEERRIALRLLWTDVADRSGLTTEALRNIRTGTGGLRGLTKRGIEESLQWAPGSVDRILAGGEPIEVARVTATSTIALGSYVRSTAVRPNEMEPTGQSASDSDTATATEAAVVRRFPNWFTSELERRGTDLAVVGAVMETLREMAARDRYTLAELLLEAGLADLPELEIRPIEEPDELAAFKEKAEKILADPRLSRGQRKDTEAYFRKLLAELEGKGAGPGR